MKQFASRLKSIRLACGMTQRAVADVLKCTTQCYSGYEIGRTEPDLGTIVALSELFDVTTDELLGADEKSEQKSYLSRYADLIEKYERLPESKRQRLRGYLDSLLEQKN